MITAITENTGHVLRPISWSLELLENRNLHHWLHSLSIILLIILSIDQFVVFSTECQKKVKSVFSKMSCSTPISFSLLIFFYPSQIVGDSFHPRHNLFIFCSSHGVFYLFSASLHLHVCKFLIISEEVTWREEFNLLIKLIAGKRDTKAFFLLYNWLTCVVVDSSI